MILCLGSKLFCFQFYLFICTFNSQTERSEVTRKYQNTNTLRAEFFETNPSHDHGRAADRAAGAGAAAAGGRLGAGAGRVRGARRLLHPLPGHPQLRDQLAPPRRGGVLVPPQRGQHQVCGQQQQQQQQ